MEKFITPQASASSRRRKITKFALAGVAVVGVGAALTSAAWSDNVWFAGDTDAADFELQGWNGAGWENADSLTNAIVLPASAFDNIAPGIDEFYDFSVLNAGEVPVFLDDPIVTVSNGLSDDPVSGNVAVTLGDFTLDEIAPGQQSTIRITLRGTDNLLENTTGRVSVQIVGSSEAP